MVTLGNESPTEKKTHNDSHCSRLGGKVVGMIYEHVKVGDMEGTVLDIPDFLTNELKGDNVQTFDTKGDEPVIELQRQPDQERLESVYFRQFDKSDQLKQLVVVDVQDTVPIIRVTSN